MAQAAAGLRATSLAASAALLGLGALAALTMRFTMAQLTPPPDFTAIEMVRPETPRQPPPPMTPQEARPPVDNPIVIDHTPTPTIETETPVETELPTIFTPPSPPSISDPHWTQRPRNLSRFYPIRARDRGVEGQVVLDCLVSPQGALACSVAQETPPGWGFAEAAQRIAREHRMVPALHNGQPVEARYRMRVPFELD